MVTALLQMIVLAPQCKPSLERSNNRLRRRDLLRLSGTFLVDLAGGDGGQGNGSINAEEDDRQSLAGRLPFPPLVPKG